MKRLIVLSFILILISSIVLAEVGIPENPLADLKLNNTNITGKVDSTLNKDIVIPEGLQLIARVLFGIKEGTISFDNLIVLLAIWAGFLYLLYQVVAFIPFFDKGVIKIIAAIVINCLISITGGMWQTYLLFYNLGDMLNFFVKLHPALKFLSFIFSIIIAGVVFFLFAYIAKKIKKKTDVEEARAVGFAAGTELAKLKARSKMPL